VYQQIFLTKKSGGQNTMFDPGVNFRPGVIWPPGSHTPGKLATAGHTLSPRNTACVSALPLQLTFSSHPV